MIYKRESCSFVDQSITKYIRTVSSSSSNDDVFTHQRNKSNRIIQLSFLSLFTKLHVFNVSDSTISYKLLNYICIT